jgi:phage terminase large subunit
VSAAAAPRINLQVTPEFAGLLEPHRYKVRWGGRGGMKSWQFARMLIARATERKLRILCARELQASIKDSVHRLLQDQIEILGLTPWFNITQNSISHKLTGAEFIFKGLRHNYTEIKSTEAIDICWVEEAQLVSKDSWEVLIPTIRKDGSEIWVSFNPIDDDDETYVRFVVNTPPDCDIKKVNWDDNPWFPPVLEKERQYMQQNDPDAYNHIWNGYTRKFGSAIIFKGKYQIHVWDTPTDPQPIFRLGLDFGYANDPMAATRSYVTGEPPDEELWIDWEVYGLGIEIDSYEHFLVHGTPEGRPGIPDVKQWPMVGDNARPESISYLATRGFNIRACEKWPGSVEDGIGHLKAFKVIHVHAERCPMIAQEFGLYSFKVDRVTRDVLPIIVDKHNHGIDSVRYAHDMFILQRGELAQWEKLGSQ